ncbi:zonular occludens toxin domain-containing protein [Eubacterium sp.]|uniref:zonular occludens toxin domain-containing protein n=1 Tax=Eubacterium sp. TaxID=142586 RepID=UPI0026E01A3C|nr:zonular occludens toxin domain-containing protein [Eubacterium sp.]MDO5434484.1 zonular occludens toxin domain-containing protein [Eubacterium sp.]
MKKSKIKLKNGKKLSKKPKIEHLSILEQKRKIIYHGKKKYHCKRLKKYYKQSGLYAKYRLLRFIKRLSEKDIKIIYFSFLRWLLVDILRGRKPRSFGIYQFVGMPGQGKTLSMVAHMERFRKSMSDKKSPYVIATNFHYINQTYKVENWVDMVRIARQCYKDKIPCLLAIDEIHLIWDSSDWKNFPPEMLSLLSFNRKYSLQFICSAQIYERIPKKIRDIANYTVICKNLLGADRMFRNYYFEKENYEAQFEGKRSKCKFIKEFIACDSLYSLYDTLAQVDAMVENTKAQKDARQEAFNLLFGTAGNGEQGEA